MLGEVCWGVGGGEMWGEVWESVFGRGGRCEEVLGEVCWGVGEVRRDVWRGVEKCVERCGGETSIWDECGRYVILHWEKVGGRRWKRYGGCVEVC